MRKNVLLVAGLCVLSTSAFASKSRMIALGQGNESRVIGDARSVFVNPAEVNNYKNYIVTEWGTSANTTDTDAAPRAEGGFFRETGSFSYGLYLGNNDSRIAVDTAAANAFDQKTNAVDLFFGGDMGVKWGARVHHASSKDEAATGAASAVVTQKTSAFGLGLGAIHGDLSGALNLDLADKANGTSGTSGASGDESKLKPSYTVDLGYSWQGNAFYVTHEGNKREEKIATTTTTKKSTETRVGWGRTHEVNPTARVFTDVFFATGSDENITAAGKTKYSRLPITLGVEAEATSWLTLRGSVSQNVVMGQTKNTAGKKITEANTTDVNGGATLTFGKLKVDGVVGTTAANGTAGDTNSEKGVLQTSNLLTRVGVTYSF